MYLSCMKKGVKGMKYLIKSLKWTNNDGIETWWKPEECGYTIFICAAGIYSEKDKVRKNYLIEQKSVEFIPLTQGVIDKAKKQNSQEIQKYKKAITEAREIYESQIASYQREIEVIKSKEIVIEQMENLMKSEEMSNE